MAARPKWLRALAVLEAGYALKISTGHRVVLSEGNQLCIVAITQKTGEPEKEVLLSIDDWHFSHIVAEFEKLTDEVLAPLEAGMALTRLKQNEKPVRSSP